MGSRTYDGRIIACFFFFAKKLNDAYDIEWFDKNVKLVFIWNINTVFLFLFIKIVIFIEKFQLYGLYRIDDSLNVHILRFTTNRHDRLHSFNSFKKKDMYINIRACFDNIIHNKFFVTTTYTYLNKQGLIYLLHWYQISSLVECDQKIMFGVF